MDWDRYIGLINILNLELADVRKTRHIIIDGDEVFINNFIKDRYFTDKFYTNIIKLSQYITNKFSDAKINLDLQINYNEVKFIYIINSVGLKKCLRLQKEYRDKRILNMRTLIMFDSPLNNTCNLYMQVSYVDDLIKVKD